jgi:hypothetical protein
MKFRKDIKIKFSEKPLPKTMFAIISSDGGVPEIIGSSGNFRESYLRLFRAEKEAQAYINRMNKESWFKNRENKIVKINTTLKKFKSRYIPIQYAFNNLLK